MTHTAEVPKEEVQKDLEFFMSLVLDGAYQGNPHVLMPIYDVEIGVTQKGSIHFSAPVAFTLKFHNRDYSNVFDLRFQGRYFATSSASKKIAQIGSECFLSIFDGDNNLIDIRKFDVSAIKCDDELEG
jgi:hypothetical protein